MKIDHVILNSVHPELSRMTASKPTLWALVALVCASFSTVQVAQAQQSDQDGERSHCRTFSIASVVEKVMNGVVNIRTTDAATSLTRKPETDDFFSLFMGTANNLERPASGSRSLGSGFFYRNRSTVVTNDHVVKDATSVTIYATDLNIYRVAKIVARDQKMDLAVLEVREVPNAVVLEIGSSKHLRPGDGVFAIGNPYGYGGTVSAGILSAKGRTVGGGALSYLLQTDVPLNPGNSGGPLFDFSGKVIGVNTANVTDAQGISFAIPAEISARRIDQLISSGSSSTNSQAWLGFRVEDIFDNPEFSAEPYGVVVTEIFKGSPAAQSGLKVGDVLRKFVGKNVSSLGQLEMTLLEIDIGRRVSIEVYRSGKTMQFNIETGTRPQKFSGLESHKVL